MKFAFPFLCAVVVVIAFFGWEQWEDARRDYASKQRELNAKQEQNGKLQRDVNNVADFLEKYNKEDEFRMREARQRTGSAAPGEIILQMDPPPRPVPREGEAPRGR